MKFPNTISINTHKAYLAATPSDGINKHILNSVNLDWDHLYPESLRVLCIKQIARTWSQLPIFSEIVDIEDRNYLLDIIDVDLPIRDLAAHITEDVFWKRCYRHRWPTRSGQSHASHRPWIVVFMEQYFTETLEHLTPANYRTDDMQQLLEICSPHLQRLHVRQMQPTMNGGGSSSSCADDGVDVGVAEIAHHQNNHIPMDFILAGLAELREIDITYDLKTIGDRYFLGCENVSRTDIKWLASGLEKCYELVAFR